MRAIVEFLSGRGTAWICVLGCALAVALTIGLVPRASSGDDQAETASTAASSGDSQRVAALVADFPHPDTGYALVVWTRRDGGSLTGADRRSITATALGVAHLSAQPALARPQLSPNRVAMLTEVQLDPASIERDAPAVLLRVRNAATRELGTTLTASLAGTVVTAADNQSAQASARLWILLVVGLIVAALVLVVTRRALAWIAQLVVVGASGWLALAVGDAVCTDLDIPFSTSAGTVVIALSFVATAAFCLAIVVRVRRELTAGTGVRDALRKTLTASATIMTATTAVLALAALSLMLAHNSDVRAIEISTAIGAILGALLVFLGLPSLLCLLGAAAFWPSIAQSAESAGTTRRPLPTGIAAGAILGLLALAAIAIQVGTVAVAASHQSAESVRVQRVIDGAFGVGTGNQAIMLVPRSLGGETSTVAPTTLAMTFGTVHSVLRVGTVDGRSELVIALDADPGSQKAVTTIQNLRTLIARTGGPTAQTIVGGADAEALDTRSSARADLATVIPLAAIILIAVLVALLIEERRFRRDSR